MWDLPACFILPLPALLHPQPVLPLFGLSFACNSTSFDLRGNDTSTFTSNEHIYFQHTCLLEKIRTSEIFILNSMSLSSWLFCPFISLYCHMSTSRRTDSTEPDRGSSHPNASPARFQLWRTDDVNTVQSSSCRLSLKNYREERRTNLDTVYSKAQASGGSQ